MKGKCKNFPLFFCLFSKFFKKPIDIIYSYLYNIIKKGKQKPKNKEEQKMMKIWVVYKENGGKRVIVAEFREKADADEYVNMIGCVRYDENLSEWDYDYYGEVREG